VRRWLLSTVVVTGVVLIALFAQPPAASAHGGGLDSYGCHNDRKAGLYHCHRGPCQGQTFESKTEMLRAPCSRSQR
jgi:hypothetical protein